MRTISKLVTSTAAITIMVSAAHAKQEQAPDTIGIFNKIEAKANFIHGENLINGSLQLTKAQDDNQQAQTLEQRANNLTTVMVTRDGDQYQAKVNPQDLAIFERAVADLERLGLDSSVFNSPGRLPDFLGKIDLSGQPQDAVIGTDDRDQITNTNQNPYYYIGRIAIGCSGTLVGPRHVLTAGHCVSDGNGNWYSSLDFSVAQNGNTKPYGSESWTNAMTVSKWHNNGNSKFDYGMIILAAAPHGGYSGYGKYSGGTHTVTGYPGDKPYGTMWTDTGSTTSDTYKIYYTLDTAGGQSGSGIRDNSNVVRGIHAYAYGSQNGGTKIKTSVYNQIQSWISNN